MDIDIKKILIESYTLLIQNDHYLLEKDVNERSITHKFAEYIQQFLGDWHVDCEYNRDADDPKSLILKVSCTPSDDTEAVTVFPDIIIHKRGTNKNFAVIECKKTSSKISDDQKLRAYLREHNKLKYKHAYKVIFPVGNQFPKNPNNIKTKDYIIEIKEGDGSSSEMA